MARRTSCIWLFASLTLVSHALGCTHVAPYEREYLAKPSMDAQREADETHFRSHVYDSREGAVGSTDSTGGGCGCN